MTDEGKMYAVKNDKGEWLVVDRNGSDHWQASHGDIYSGWFSANDRVSVFGGHLVELMEAPEKVVVNAEEAKMLKKAKNTTVWRPAAVIQKYAYEHEQQADDEVLLEGRLMRAYVNGWTVEKPKRYVLPMPNGVVGDRNRAMRIAIRDKDEGWYGSTYRYDVTASETPSYTKADLNNAPGWVKAITPVEVTDDEL